MGNKISLGVIILSVTAMCYFMVELVIDFNEHLESKRHVTAQEAARDSILNEKLRLFEKQDSAMSELIQEQFVRTEQLSKDLRVVRNKIIDIYDRSATESE